MGMPNYADGKEKIIGNCIVKRIPEMSMSSSRDGKWKCISNSRDGQGTSQRWARKIPETLKGNPSDGQGNYPCRLCFNF